VKESALRASLRLGRYALVLAAAPLLLAACYSGTSAPNQTTFGDILWTMIAFFFWFMLVWMFIAVFADIFRRTDLSGGMKAIWILAIFVLPLLGILIYLVSRPKVTPDDVKLMAQAEAQSKAVAGVSTADELAKLQQLKASGALTDAEYESLKAKLLA
jgi:predicted membrane channel-forming protein YqfA (hemolysin III family)